jgi:hypothetical protein
MPRNYFGQDIEDEDEAMQLVDEVETPAAAPDARQSSDDMMLAAYNDMNPKLVNYLKATSESNRERKKERDFGNLVENLQHASAKFGSIGGVAPQSTFKADKPEDQKLDPRVLSYLGKEQRTPTAYEMAKTNYLNAKTKTVAEGGGDGKGPTGWQQYQMGKDAQDRADKLAKEQREKDERIAAEKAKSEKLQADKLAEARTRSQNIERVVDEMKAMIEENGTYEVFGPHNAKLKGRLEDLAVEYAKLSDPDSVARPSEVEQVKKQLAILGATRRDSTALATLEDFKQRAKNTLSTREGVITGKSPLVLAPNMRAKGGLETTAIAAPKKKSVKEMTDEELQQELGQ